MPIDTTVEQVEARSPEALSVEERFENYSKEGGTLNKSLFQTILEQVKTFDPKKLTPPAKLQPVTFAKSAGIDVSPETSLLYGFMRTQPIELTPEQREDVAIVGQLEGLKRINDHPLFAEVLIMMGEARDSVLFKNKYPEIIYGVPSNNPAPSKNPSPV